MLLASALVLSLGADFELPRTTTNIRVVSGIFFIFSLIFNCVFSFISFKISTYVIISGIAFLLFLSLVYFIAGVRD